MSTSSSKATKIVVFFLFLLGISCKLIAQYRILIEKDTIKDSSVVCINSDYRLEYKQLILPSIFIAYGAANLNIKALKQLNFSARDEILENNLAHTHLDNYTQFLPAAIVYGLDAVNIKGKHSFVDRTVIYATSQLLSASMVFPLKYLVKERRPDNSDYLSFPSGHTATAFSSAQFMFREYKDKNIWLSLSGYPIAVFTGIYRVINNKHWVGDVVAGAGFGILSTDLAYWMYPQISTWLGRNKNKAQTMVVPFYQQGSYNIGFIRNF